jgi:hypothetical protein
MANQIASQLRVASTPDLIQELSARYDEVLILGIAPKGRGKDIDVKTKTKPEKTGQLPRILQNLLARLGPVPVAAAA